MKNELDVQKLKLDLENEADRYADSAALLRNADQSDNIAAVIGQMDYLLPDDADIKIKALQVLKDRSLPVENRVNTLEKINTFLYDDAEAVQVVIAILADVTEVSQMRQAALNALRSVRFSSLALKYAMADFKKALRALLQEENTTLRTTALEMLANDQDIEALEIIKDGVLDTGKAVFPEAKAIQLLGADRTNGYQDLIREKLGTSEDPDVVVEALYALSSDPDSQLLIQQKLEDKTGLKDIRLSSVNALSNLAPDAFLQSAKKILTDDQDYDDVKIASINTLAIDPNFKLALDDQELEQQVTALAQKTKGYQAAAKNFWNAKK